MGKNQLTGEDKEYADKFLIKFGEAVLGELETEAKKIQTDLRVGALHANNFDSYLNKQSEAGKFLLKIVVDNMAAHMRDPETDTAQ